MNKDDRDRRGCLLRGGRGTRVRAHEHIDPAVDQIGDQPRNTASVAFRPAVFDREVAAFDKTGLAQPLVPSFQPWRGAFRVADAEKSDNRNFRLLGTRCERPHSHQSGYHDRVANPYTVLYADAVIASETKQIGPLSASSRLLCYCAPRNDGLSGDPA
jgi:hypothetical protein